MRRYRFPLASVQRVRHIEEDLARGAVAIARADERRAAETLALREEAAAHARTSGLYTGRSFRAAAAVSSHRVAAIGAAAAALGDSQVAVAARLGEWEASHRRSTVLDRLDERLREEHAVEATRAETVEVDDIVSARHHRPGAQQ